MTNRFAVAILYHDDDVVVKKRRETTKTIIIKFIPVSYITKNADSSCSLASRDVLHSVLGLHYSIHLTGTLFMKIVK